jgi:epsin
MDEERLRTERANRGSWKSRVTGLEDMGAMGGYQGEPSMPRENRQRNRTNEDDNDLEFRLALEASKNEAEEAARKRPQAPTEETDDDLAKALKLSREEEELRKRELDDQNQANLLFDDTPAQTAQPTGFNQGYQQQAAVDWFGNPVQQQQQQQQPQQTGFLNNAYNQPTGMQPQQTGFQNGYGGYGYQQPQQQPQQTGFQQQSLQPQNTYNPWAQQMNGFGQQQQQQQQPIQEQQTATPGSNNPWATPAQTMAPIGAQPTGSNNPFATHRPTPQSTTPKQPTLSSLQEQQTTNQFPQRVNPIANFSPSPAPQQQQPPPIQQQNTTTQDPYQSRLNALLASGEGQDTFGNTGDMRLPAQHTAPGTFVNSAGAGSMGRLEAAKTGNNPFFNQQQPLQGQYTGMPATQFPAQTGPALGGYGQQQNNNPFGARPGQQQQGQQQGGSLIDL